MAAVSTWPSAITSLIILMKMLLDLDKNAPFPRRARPLYDVDVVPIVDVDGDVDWFSPPSRSCTVKAFTHCIST